MPKEWLIAPPWEGRDQLAVTLGTSPTVAQILFNRDIADVETARQFMRPNMNDLIVPERLPGARQAAERIAAAVSRRDRIVIYGDYDVDGITGVSILWHCLTLAGANVDYYIPHRLDEGYGIHAAAVEQLAAEGAKLIVTVDCGITGVAAAEAARRRGVELIITDHHQPHVAEDGSIELPDALIVHPALPDDDCPRYANPHISGAGVAFKVAWAVAQAICGAEKVSEKYREFLRDALALAALGTVADVVPLTGENRLIARFGLGGLTMCRLHGVVALIESAGLTGKKLSGYDIGFKLGPRLNAIGRMGHARLAVEMFTRAAPDEAARIAKNLESQNRARQTLERRITAEAKEQVLATGQHLDGCRAIVAASKDWHAGVIGIVASRLVDEFHRPAVMIALDNGMGQGSARSVRHFALHEALGACRKHLTTFGGHAMAAGLKIQAECVDAFREAFAAEAARRLTHADLTPRLRVDDVASLDSLDEQLVSDLARLEPYGNGNAEPRLATDWLQLAGEPRAVGANKEHLQLTLKQGSTVRKGIAFGMASRIPELLDHRRCRVAFRPMLNEWNGRTSVEMQVIDLHTPNDANGGIGAIGSRSR